MRIVWLTGVVALTACAGAEAPPAAGSPPPEVVQAMTVPDSPYYIIYHPPVWLGKEGTQPGTQQRR